MFTQGCPLRPDLSAEAVCVPTSEETAGLSLLGRVFLGSSLGSQGWGNNLESILKSESGHVPPLLWPLF